MTKDEMLDRVSALSDEIDANEEESRLNQEEINRLYGQIYSREARLHEIKYSIDPECWVSYSGHPKNYKREMDYRRKLATEKAHKQFAEEFGETL